MRAGDGRQCIAGAAYTASKHALIGLIKNVGYPGEPEEIARIALFLTADHASLVNGTVIIADAGWTAY